MAQMLTAREAYLQRVRDENWIKNWPLLCVLTHGGLRPMAAAMAVQAVTKSLLHPPKLQTSKNRFLHHLVSFGLIHP